MAIEFNASASDSNYMVNAAALSAPPLTFCAWAKPRNDNVSKTLLFVGDKDNTGRYVLMQARSTSRCSLQIRNGATNTVVDTANSYAVDQWNFFAGWVASDGGAVTSLLNLDWGNAGTAGADGHTANAWDRTAVGASRDSSPEAGFDGFIAEVAIWDTVLSRGEINAAGRGTPFFLIRPERLALYPDMRQYRPSLHNVGHNKSIQLSAVGSADHSSASDPSFRQGL